MLNASSSALLDELKGLNQRIDDLILDQEKLIAKRQKLVSDYAISRHQVWSQTNVPPVKQKSKNSFKERYLQVKHLRQKLKKNKNKWKIDYQENANVKEEIYQQLTKKQRQTEVVQIHKQLKKDYHNLRHEYKIKKHAVRNNSSALLELNKWYDTQSKELLGKINLVKKGISKKLFLLSFITIPVVAIIAFLVAFLYYTPKTNGGKTFDLGPGPQQSQYIAAIVLIVLILIVGIFFIIVMMRAGGKIISDEKNKSYTKSIGIGFVCDFLDTIGIGSFAPSIAMLRGFKQVDDDKKIPGTLNVGHSIPSVIEAVIFFSAINMDAATLVLLIFCSVLGAYLGAFIANKVNTMWMKLVIGLCLLVMVIFLILGQPYNWEYITHLNDPTYINMHKSESGAPLDKLSGSANGLYGWKLAVGAIAYVILGFLQSFGIGLYAPAMATVSILGMGAIFVYPIMAGACAFTMPIGSGLKFIADKNYLAKTSSGIGIGGSVGVLCAFLVVFVGIQIGANISKEVFMYWLKWLVIAIIIYTTSMMLNDFQKVYRMQKKVGSPLSKLETS